MRINRAIGLGIGILVLQLFAGSVFASLEATILAGLDLSRTAIDVAEHSLVATPSVVPPQLIPTLPH